MSAVTGKIDTDRGPLLTIPQLAKKIECCAATVRNMMANGMEYRWVGKLRKSTFEAYLRYDAKQKENDFAGSQIDDDEFDQEDFDNALEELRRMGVKKLAKRPEMKTTDFQPENQTATTAT